MLQPTLRLRKLLYSVQNIGRIYQIKFVLSIISLFFLQKFKNHCRILVWRLQIFLLRLQTGGQAYTPQQQRHRAKPSVEARSQLPAILLVFAECFPATQVRKPNAFSQHVFPTQMTSILFPFFKKKKKFFTNFFLSSLQCTFLCVCL